MSTANPTYNERLLAQVRALLLGKMLDDVAMYKIGTRELTKIPLAELTLFEAQLERRVLNERVRAGTMRQKSYRITFGRDMWTGF